MLTPEDYYLFLLFQARSQETTTAKLQNILKDLIFLGKTLKDWDVSLSS